MENLEKKKKNNNSLNKILKVNGFNMTNEKEIQYYKAIVIYRIGRETQ